MMLVFVRDVLSFVACLNIATSAYCDAEGRGHPSFWYGSTLASLWAGVAVMCGSSRQQI